MCIERRARECFAAISMSVSKEVIVKSKLQMPSPAMAVACLALIISLGPVAYAANSIFSEDIVDGEVKTADLADANVTGPKLAPNSVSAGKVLNNSLTTADIKGADQFT